MELHLHQLEILKKLMYNPKLNFSNLQIDNLTSKHFNYHLKVLVENELVQKCEGGYQLTLKGKQFVAKVDEADMNIEQQPKVNVGVLIERINKKGEKEFLVSKRLKHPYYGKVGGLTGKIRFGEQAEDTARREVFEETGMTGDFQLAGISRKMAYQVETKENISKRVFIQDQVMFLFRVTNPVGKLKEKIADQENFWQSYDQILKRDDLFDTFLEYLKFSYTNKMESIEKVVEAQGF